MRRVSLVILFVQLAYWSFSQCSSGEVEVSLTVSTDNFGSEIYWELVPLGSNCGGSGTVGAGGNSAVGCNGAGAQAQPQGGYGNNVTVVEGPWCVTDGADYQIISIDDWGDGGPTYVVNIAGTPTQEFAGTGDRSTFNFTASAPPALEISLEEISTIAFVNKGDITISGEFQNRGANAITSVDINYSIDNGTTFTQAITGINVQPFQLYSFNHDTPWNEGTSGEYSVKVWLSNVNGQSSDADDSNNQLTKVITVKEPIPNIIPSYLSASSTFDFKVVANSSDQVSIPTDLDFHPNGDLWVTNFGTENTGGSTVKITNPSSDSPTTLWQRDGNAWHFMSLPSALAFSDNGNFATSTAVFDANHSGGNSPFTGPSLWSSDPAIYAQPSGGNGSHLDMLHESPHCMGIAAYHDNAFWVFDKYNNDIVMYDFKDDHGPGNDDHSDAVIFRYPEVAVEWIEQSIPSHLKYDRITEQLYIVDGGNSRILQMDVNSGTVGGTPSFGPVEALTQYENVTGVSYKELTNTGFTEACGIDVMHNYMIVSDYSNGDIIIYDNNTFPATEAGRIVTGSPGVAGVVIGPEGRIWYVNNQTHEVVKIEPSEIIASTPQQIHTAKVNVYPNPASSTVYLNFNENWQEEKQIRVIDTYGKVLVDNTYYNEQIEIEMSGFKRGIYFIEAIDNENKLVKKLVLK